MRTRTKMRRLCTGTMGVGMVAALSSSAFAFHAGSDGNDPERTARVFTRSMFEEGIRRGRLDWSWLGENGGTYWYVPEEYLPAIRWSTDDPEGYSVINDQTLWYIERFEDGYIFGPLAVKLDTPAVICQFLIGSITPVGSVYIAFNGLADLPSGSPALTIGLGQMVRKKGEWMFSMQMASGPAAFQLEHWAFMRQCTPADDCWDDLPGVDMGVLEFLAQCE